MSRTAHSPPNSEDMKDPGATKWVAYATRQGLESTLPCSSSLSPRLSESRSISHEQSYQPFSNHGQSYPIVIDTSKSMSTQQTGYQFSLCQENMVKPRELSDPPLCFCGIVASERKSKKEGDITIYECGYNQQHELTTSIVVCTFHMHKEPWTKYQWRMRNKRPVFQDDNDLSSCDMLNYTFCVLFQAHNTFPLRPLRTPLCYCNVPAQIYSTIDFDHRYFAGCHTDFKCLWTLPAQDIRVLRIPWNNKPSSPPPSSLVATEEDALIYTKKESPLQHGNDNHTLNLLSTTASTSGADILKLLQKTKLSLGDDSDKVTPSSDENVILKLLQETKLSSDTTSLSADDDDNKNDDMDHPTHDNDNITTTITNITPVSSGSTRYTENNSGLERLRRRLEQLEKKVQRVRMENQRYRDQCSEAAAAANESDNNDTTHVPTGANDNLPQEEYLGINADQQSLTTNNQNQHCTMLLESLMMPLDMDEKSVLGHTTPTTTTTITTTTQQIKSDTDQGKKGEGR